MTSYSGWAGHSLTVVVPVQLQRGLSHTPLPFHSISFFPQNSTSFYLNILLHSFPLNPFSPSFLFPFNHVPFHSFPSLLSPPPLQLREMTAIMKTLPCGVITTLLENPPCCTSLWNIIKSTKWYHFHLIPQTPNSYVYRDLCLLGTEFDTSRMC